MRYQTESPGLTARLSPGRRGASMRRFERLHTRVLTFGSVAAVITMTTLVFLTGHLFN